jgi:hypothetical protein
MGQAPAVSWGVFEVVPQVSYELFVYRRGAVDVEAQKGWATPDSSTPLQQHNHCHQGLQRDFVIHQPAAFMPPAHTHLHSGPGTCIILGSDVGHIE